jgi:hypothetical protein
MRRRGLIAIKRIRNKQFTKPSAAELKRQRAIEKGRKNG